MQCGTIVCLLILLITLCFRIILSFLLTSVWSQVRPFSRKIGKTGIYLRQWSGFIFSFFALPSIRLLIKILSIMEEVPIYCCCIAEAYNINDKIQLEISSAFQSLCWSVRPHRCWWHWWSVTEWFSGKEFQSGALIGIPDLSPVVVSPWEGYRHQTRAVLHV